jgi:hypothetical protein
VLRCGDDTARLGDESRRQARLGLRLHAVDFGRRRPALKAFVPRTDRHAMDAAAARSTRLTWLALAFGTTLALPLVRVGADARWLAAMGGEIVRTGSIPARIPYAAAPSVHWANVPVLAELVFHALEAALGDRGLVLAQVVAVVLALVFLALDMRAAGIPDAARSVVLVAVLVAAVPAFTIARSQLFSLALFPLLLLLLRAEARAPSRRIWLLVPLIALWSNLHGAVLVGLFVAGVYLVVERFRHQRALALGVLGASVAALFLTPALLRSAAYYAGVLGGEAAKTGDGMWAPLSPHSFFDVTFVVVALPLAVLALRSRPALWELLCLVVLAAAAVHTSRNTVWFALFAAAPAAKQLARFRFSRFVPRRRITALCYFAPLLLAVVGLAQPPVATSAGAPLLRTTIALAAGKPILADDLDAERLALDGQRVWIANPLDAFSSADQRGYLDWLHGDPAGDRLRDRIGAPLLVLRGSPAEKRLARDPAYRSVAHDRVAVLYVRKQSG